EDGIRDDLVTGVQTCALPIYDGPEHQLGSGRGKLRAAHPAGESRMTGFSEHHGHDVFENALVHIWRCTVCRMWFSFAEDETCREIGRASCRERLGSSWAEG